MLNKPHWDNAERIKNAFIELARAYKNDSSIGNVFGKPLRGRRVKNDYVIDSSNSMYPYAKEIEFKEEVRTDSKTLTRGVYWKLSLRVCL